jgi:hypothetical protein
MEDQNNKYYVYQLRIDGCDVPFYVGKGCGNRAWQHLCDWSRSKRSHKNNVINKAVREGKEIIVEFLEKDLKEVDSLNLERYYISAYGRYNDGYILTNCTGGGDGSWGLKHTEQTKLLISAIAKNRTPEHQHKLNQSLRGHKRSASGNDLVSDIHRKLSEDDYVHICILLHEGVAQRTIAKLFSVGHTAIGNIKLNLKYKRWHHYYTGDYPTEIKND